MGPVFRGEDGETRDPVVIKVIRVGLTPERVAIVAAALTALKERLASHPALAEIIDTGVVDVEPYVVSPFIDGDSLDVALREYGPAHMNDALPRLKHIADAMDAAAAVGAAHGSLHPRDIVVSVEATVLTGMGIAAVLERVGVRPPVRRPYCAPEVALGHGISPAADQYALAAVAHEWLSGRRLSGSGAAGFLVPALSEAGTTALHAVFARAMHESADERFPTATAFVDAVVALAGHAGPRSKSSRRPAAVAAPRLAFDDPAEATISTDDDLVPPDAPVGHDDELGVAASAAPDPLEAPLHAAPSPEGLAWDTTAERQDPLLAYSTVDDDEAEREAPGLGDRWSAEVAPDPDQAPFADEAAFADDAAPPDGAALDVDTPSDAGRTWGTWALLLALATAAALTGGWLLLRWGTPAPASIVATGTARPPAADAPPTPSDLPAAAATPDQAALPPSVPAPAAAASETPPAAEATPKRPAPTAAPPLRPAGPVSERGAPPQSTAAPGAALAAAGGRVLVRTTPGGAEVFVNGERRGVTPLALRDLPFGAYTVRVVRAGYAPVEQRVAIDSGRPARSVEITLARTAAAPPAATGTRAGPATEAPGSLLVDSRPPGARVIVDGTDVGVTPVTVSNLAAGIHAVRIERPGYVPITTTARVEARLRARVAVTLTAERPR
ncbi:MAG: PEGA domain-containing protein [Acidobacteria bacterium]|nr:PEGA domain-containing protein [Acidobacteriota bacterium]